MNWLKETKKPTWEQLGQSFLKFLEVATKLFQSHAMMLFYHAIVSLQKLQNLDIHLLSFLHALDSLRVVI